MGAISKKKVPEIAITFKPLNGFAAESIASAQIKAAIIKNQGRFPDSVSQVNLGWAKRAFVAEPATPEAIAVLAIDKSGTTAQRLMTYAFSLSRREQVVTGWMIADSEARQDVAAILSYYDTMLRTNSSSRSVILPIMANALSNQTFLEPFAELLSANPPWARFFWAQVVKTPEAIGNAALLRERLYKENELTESYRDLGLISALVKNKMFAEAEKLYGLLSNMPTDQYLVKNGSFEHQPKYPPLDWQLSSNGEYGAAIGDGSLQLSAIRNSGGLFARQLVKLPARTLEIEVQSTQIISKDIDVYMNISCAEATDVRQRTARFPLVSKSTRRKISNRSADCLYYWLDISGRALESGDGLDVVLDSVSLKLE